VENDVKVKNGSMKKLETFLSQLSIDLRLCNCRVESRRRRKCELGVRVKIKSKMIKNVDVI